MKTEKLIDAKLFPETAKFQGWFDAEKANGLVDIKFFSQKAEDATLESFFAEVNAVLASPATDDPEIF